MEGGLDTLDDLNEKKKKFDLLNLQKFKNYEKLLTFKNLCEITELSKD